LCYSFSEAGQTKYVSIIEAQPNQNVSYEKIVLKNGKSLVRKTFDDVEKAIAWLSENQNTLVELTLESETYLRAEERKLIYGVHNGIVRLIPKVKNKNFNENQLHEINLNQDIQSLFKDYFKTKNNAQEPNDELLDLFSEILNP
jgi:exonuclease SbcD